MTERLEVEIIEELPDDTGAGILKTAHGYAFRKVYRLVTGELIPTTTSRRLLRDAKAEIASLPKVPEHPTTAQFHDGRFVGTATSYYIGPRR